MFFIINLYGFLFIPKARDLACPYVKTYSKKISYSPCKYISLHTQSLWFIDFISSQAHKSIWLSWSSTCLCLIPHPSLNSFPYCLICQHPFLTQTRFLVSLTQTTLLPFHKTFFHTKTISCMNSTTPRNLCDFSTPTKRDTLRENREMKREGDTKLKKQSQLLYFFVPSFRPFILNFDICSPLCLLLCLVTTKTTPVLYFFSSPCTSFYLAQTVLFHLLIIS